MIFYTLFLTEVLSLPWQLLHMQSIGSAQLFLLLVNEYVEDVISEFFIYLITKGSPRFKKVQFF